MSLQQDAQQIEGLHPESYLEIEADTGVPVARGPDEPKGKEKPYIVQIAESTLLEYKDFPWLTPSAKHERGWHGVSDADKEKDQKWLSKFMFSGQSVSTVDQFQRSGMGVYIKNPHHKDSLVLSPFSPPSSTPSSHTSSFP